MSRSRRTGMPCRSSSSALVVLARVCVHESGDGKEKADEDGDGCASRRRQLRQVGDRARRGVAILVSSGSAGLQNALLFLIKSSKIRGSKALSN
jgi:hypothetical protein